VNEIFFPAKDLKMGRPITVLKLTPTADKLHPDEILTYDEMMTLTRQRYPNIHPKVVINACKNGIMPNAFKKSVDTCHRKTTTANGGRWHVKVSDFLIWLNNYKPRPRRAKD
jgi:hypothetical protein